MLDPADVQMLLACLEIDRQAYQHYAAQVRREFLVQRQAEIDLS